VINKSASLVNVLDFIIINQGTNARRCLRLRNL